MFAHPLTSFWSHLEASNCHIVKSEHYCRFINGTSKIHYFTVDSCLGSLAGVMALFVSLAAVLWYCLLDLDAEL